MARLVLHKVHAKNRPKVISQQKTAVTLKREEITHFWSVGGPVGRGSGTGMKQDSLQGIERASLHQEGGHLPL